MQLLCTVERGGPFENYDACIGGDVLWDEDRDARSAALRELARASGIHDPPHFETLDTYDANGRDPGQWAENDSGGGSTAGSRVVSKTFLALICRGTGAWDATDERARWVSVYDYLPWEDLRQPARIAEVLTMLAVLKRAWVQSAVPELRAERLVDIATSFGRELSEWNEERAGERTRSLLAGGLLEEAHRDQWGRGRIGTYADEGRTRFGEAMAFDHRLMVADALGRLRGKLKYVPAILAALLGDEITLPELQVACESIGGRLLHTANFRRAMVETTCLLRKLRRRAPARSRGPRATLWAFPREVARMRLDPGIRMPWLRLPPGALA